MEFPVQQTTSQSELPMLEIFEPSYMGVLRYEVVGQLREQDPPLAIDPLGQVHLLRYADVRAALEDSERFRAIETGAALALGMTEGPFYDFENNVVLTQNPPRHTRVRRCAARFFQGRRIQALEQSIRDACDELIDALPEGEPFDFGEEFVFKLPVGVIMRMLHLPAEDEAKIRQWSPRTLPVGPRDQESADEANAHMREYAEAVIAERRAQPLDDDIITDLVRAQAEGELSEDDLWALVVALRLAGHETTTSTLSTGRVALLRHPEQMEQLRRDRSLLRRGRRAAALRAGPERRWPHPERGRRILRNDDRGGLLRRAQPGLGEPRPSRLPGSRAPGHHPVECPRAHHVRGRCSPVHRRAFGSVRDTDRF